MRDVHATVPRQDRLTLHRVGLEGIRRPVVVRRPDRAVTLSASFAIAVDLPAGRKGSDLSRNAESLGEAIDGAFSEPVASLEGICAAIARDLLARHPSATQSEVRAEAEYFLRRTAPGGRQSLEDYTLLAEGQGRRASGAIRVERSVGAEAVGMTACPCAMESARDLLTAEFPVLGDAANAELPVPTHNQRARTRLLLSGLGTAEVEVDRIIEAIEGAHSAPTYAILKRADEARLVIGAHRRPKFVEDVLRDLLAEVPVRFPELPEEAVASARCRSEESIHKYDVVASHAARIGELRRLRQSGSS